MQVQLMSQSNKSGGYAIFAIFLIFIVIVVILLLWKSSPAEAEPNETNSMLFYATNEQGEYIKTNYTLYKDSILWKEGDIQGSQEEISPILNNTNYTFTAFNPEYYSESKVCTIDSQSCSVALKKTANPEIFTTNISDNVIRYTIRINDGIIRKPLLCFTWGYDVLLVKTSLEEYNDSLTFDRCYTFNRDINETYTDLDIQQENIGVNYISYTINLLDYCDGDYLNGCMESKVNQVN